VQDRNSCPAIFSKRGASESSLVGKRDYEADIAHCKGSGHRHRKSVRRRSGQGHRFIRELLELFLADPATNSIVMIGEIGSVPRKKEAGHH